MTGIFKRKRVVKKSTKKGTEKEPLVVSIKKKSRGNKFFSGIPLRKFKTIMPEVFYMKHIFTWSTISYGAESEQNFRMNSVYDPDQTGTGDSAQLYDLMAARYQNYLVLGAKISAKFYRTNTGEVYPSFYMLARQQDNADVLPDSWANLQDYKGIKYKIMNGTPNSSSNFVHLKDEVDLTQFSGEVVLDQERHGSGVGTNPTDIMNWGIMFARLDGGGSLSAVSAVIKITYFVKWLVPTDIIPE